MLKLATSTEATNIELKTRSGDTGFTLQYSNDASMYAKVRCPMSFRFILHEKFIREPRHSGCGITNHLTDPRPSALHRHPLVSAASQVPLGLDAKGTGWLQKTKSRGIRDLSWTYRLLAVFK